MPTGHGPLGGFFEGGQLGLVGQGRCDVREDAFPEPAEDGRIKAVGPGDKQLSGLVRHLRAGLKRQGSDRLCHHPTLLDGHRTAEQRVTHRLWGGVDGGGELDQLAGGATGKPQPLPQPDGGGRGALGDREAARVDLAHQTELDGSQPLRQHVGRVETREQVVVGERPQ